MHMLEAQCAHWTIFGAVTLSTLGACTGTQIHERSHWVLHENSCPAKCTHDHCSDCIPNSSSSNVPLRSLSTALVFIPGRDVSLHWLHSLRPAALPGHCGTHAT
uniref:Secreted protein n=1 Tax=Cacopsylla melanoneura TaxID=428564 RepID=A0A8D8W4Q1_9HEMI